MVVVGTTLCRSVDDCSRCIKAFELILSGKNQYYKDRLQDPEFVAVVTHAMEAEKAELDLLTTRGGEHTYK